jgi:hypothetical protein
MDIRDSKNFLLSEIKINTPPRRAVLNTGDRNDIIVYKKGIKWNDIKDKPFLPDFENPEEVTWSLISFPNEKNTNKMWWNDDEINFNINENVDDFQIGKTTQSGTSKTTVTDIDPLTQSVTWKVDKDITDKDLHRELSILINKLESYKKDYKDTKRLASLLQKLKFIRNTFKRTSI